MNAEELRETVFDLLREGGAEGGTGGEKIMPEG